MLHKHFLGCLPCAVITHVLLSLSSGGQGCRTLQSGPAHGSVPSCSPDLCAVQPDLISEWEDASENRNAEPEAQHRELCVPDALAVPGSQSPAYQLEQCKSEVERDEAVHLQRPLLCWVCITKKKFSMERLPKRGIYRL